MENKGLAGIFNQLAPFFVRFSIDFFCFLFVFIEIKVEQEMEQKIYQKMMGDNAMARIQTR